MGVGAAIPLAYIASPKGGKAPPVRPAVEAPPAAEPVEEGGSGSNSLVFLVGIVALVIIAGNAVLHLWRRRKQRYLHLDWHPQDAQWEAAVRQIETEREHQTSTNGSEPERSEVG